MINIKQYQILKWMLKLGATPKQIVQQIGISKQLIVDVETTDSFDQFNELQQLYAADEFKSVLRKSRR